MDHTENERAAKELAIGAFMSDLKELLVKHGVRFHTESDWEGGDYVYLYQEEEQLSQIIDFAELYASAYVYTPPPPMDQQERNRPFLLSMDKIQAALKEDYLSEMERQLFGVDAESSILFRRGLR